MAKRRCHYVCQACGHHEAKWLGRCPGCGSWNTLSEEIRRTAPTGSRRGVGASASHPQRLSEIHQAPCARTVLGIPELDRVLGGGLVPGALVLVGGDPGIGKSTLLLQAVGALAARETRVLYVSAEESVHQVKLRAERLGLGDIPLFLLATTRLEEAEQAVEEITPSVVVVDSIQTVGSDTIDSATGSVSQIRAVTQRLMEIAKGRSISTFVVGHVTKEGTIAGPKVMEHMVDTVLYFEGDRGGAYRILRSHKNRFGPAYEVGVFEMRSDGLAGVDNPSEFFLSQRCDGPGSMVVSSLEGTRPLLLEVQALSIPSVYANPKRTAVGIDPQRVAMLSAVLERHGGCALQGHDLYVNVAGGVRLHETAADLGVVLALASTLRGCAPQHRSVAIGEVGLAGEVRAVSELETRIQEAQHLGFKRCLVPAVQRDRIETDLALDPVGHISEALERAGL